MLYSPLTAVGIVGLSFLGAGLAASAGVLISLRASTVRQAQQTMSIAIMLLLLVPVLGMRALAEESKTWLASTLVNAGLVRVLLTVMLSVAVLDALLLVVAMGRFKRSRLVLD